MILVFIALVLYNLNGVLGGTNILNGDLHPLFNHQTVLEDSHGGKIQSSRNIKNSISGIDDIVAVADEGACEDFGHVKKGSITFRIDPIPVFEMCYLKDAYIGTIYADVIGGYEPYLWAVDDQDQLIGGKQYIYLSQDKDPEKGGRARIEWQLPPNHVCCKYDYYMGYIYADEKISLDSDQYPYVYGQPDCSCTFGLKDVTDDPAYEDGYADYIDFIFGKMVDLDFVMDWSGCHYYDLQGFTIIPLRAYH